jgi:hypothetical protein
MEPFSLLVAKLDPSVSWNIHRLRSIARQYNITIDGRNMTITGTWTSLNSIRQRLCIDEQCRQQTSIDIDNSLGLYFCARCEFRTNRIDRLIVHRQCHERLLQINMNRRRLMMMVHRCRQCQFATFSKSM